MNKSYPKATRNNITLYPMHWVFYMTWYTNIWKNISTLLLEQNSFENDLVHHVSER